MFPWVHIWQHFCRESPRLGGLFELTKCRIRRGSSGTESACLRLCWEASPSKPTQAKTSLSKIMHSARQPWSCPWWIVLRLCCGRVQANSCTRPTRLGAVCARVAFALLLPCICFVLALLLLCSCFAFALLLLCFCFAFALYLIALLCLCSAFALLLICSCFAFALHLPCFALHLLCSRFALALVLLCFCYALALLLLCFCSRYAFAMRVFLVFALILLCFLIAISKRCWKMCWICPKKIGSAWTQNCVRHCVSNLKVLERKAHVYDCAEKQSQASPHKPRQN